MKMYDFIIVGQGIAGSMLAWFLLRASQRVLIIDEFNPYAASRVASGIINPVTGKRLVKSWKADDLIPFAKKTYRQLEKEFRANFFFRKPICRIFSNKEDYRFFRQRNGSGELPEYVKTLSQIPDCFNDAPWGGIEISEAYQADYAALLALMRGYFRERDKLIEEKFNYENLMLKEGRISYKNIEALKIIFCEGSGAARNPYFRWLPFNFAKGEVITVKMKNFPGDCIWHKGVFILPLQDNLFRVGATYEWNFTDDYPSVSGKEALITRLSKAVKVPFEVMNHHAAIRPTVTDRRPLIGLHPKYNQVGIFNGLGTKGASLAPFFSHQFAMHLVNGATLNEEVNINRFSREPFFPANGGLIPS